ncbi:MAG: HEAT repeat domain-containing protein, partial [Deltaproteobacteria bacterium]|nr:HEAT repeat domain-containing protein [Deltaproteobacteria bacterium]
VQRLASHRDPVIRRHALSVLSKIGGPLVLETLDKALIEKSLEHRIAAMDAIAPLMRRGGPAARKLAGRVQASLRASDWREQVAAASAMGRYGRGADRGALTKVVGDPRRKAFVRQAAATSLGQLRAKKAITALTRAARDPSRAVQEQAVLALRAIGGPRARAALKAIARDSKVSASARALARSPARSRKN